MPRKTRCRLSKRLIDSLWELFVRVKYPKLALLGCMIALAYLSFRTESVQSFFHSLGDIGYASAFVGGMLFAFGFGAPFGVAILMTIADDVNLFLGAALGGIGALASDFLLFKFIRATFDDEIERLKRSSVLGRLGQAVAHKMPPRLWTYLLVGIAGMVIASPLPDEFGVAMLAGATKISSRAFGVVSFLLNTLGIMAVLGLGQAV